MSIASEIYRIKSNIANAYDVCYRKGADMPSPENQNSDHLSNCIYSIPYEVGGIPREVSYDGTYSLPQNWYTFTLPNNATSIGDHALDGAFAGSERIQCLNINNVVNIPGAYALSNVCKGLPYLQYFDAPNLETVSGGSALYNAFMDTDLQSAYFPKLKSVTGNGTFTYAFSSCPLSDVYFPKLETINGSATFNRAFGVNEGETNYLHNVEFPALRILKGTAPLRYLFAYRTGLQTVSFPSLNSDSFGSLKTQFDNMLIGIDGCTVHFPSNLQSVIGTWASVQNGFGGTNTIVSFDLDPTS